MPALYLVEQQTKIRIRNRRVQVERDLSPDAQIPSIPQSPNPSIPQSKNPEILLSVPLAQVEQVVIFGNVGLTTPAIDAFLAQNTEVVFLSQRGEYRGRLVGSATPRYRPVLPVWRRRWTRWSARRRFLRFWAWKGRPRRLISRDCGGCSTPNGTSTTATAARRATR